ncbi:MAG: HIT domain-containing protein [Candidatus Liptonbacteria bacterium]|nr:HIT domain-containing protein [Candidatus Liptonbacteria bacterium]
MSELRQNLVSGDWIISATGRAKRPKDLVKKKKPRVRVPKTVCPFEDLEKSGNLPIELFPPGENWRIAVISNKFPILSPKISCADETKRGLYSVIDGVGHHELVITRDHDKNLSQLTKKDSAELFRVFKHRLTVFSEDPCSDYCSLFHAWGPTAGGTVYHPHYQMLTLPILPPDVRKSLEGSVRYARKNNKCVHCVMLAYEKRHKKRIVYENADAIAIAPFSSKQPFEIRIFPKKHEARFEKTDDKILAGVADVLSFSLRRVKEKLADPDYNFFLHTAPFRKAEEYDMYHWHMEVVPKTSLLGGFEWSTGIDVNVIDPDEAAKFLRVAKRK